jgi:hypothetical protein
MASCKMSCFVLFIIFGITIQLCQFGVEGGFGGRRGLGDDSNNNGFGVGVGVNQELHAFVLGCGPLKIKTY